MKRTDEMKLGEKLKRPRDLRDGAENAEDQYEELIGIRIVPNHSPSTGPVLIGEVSFKDKNFSWDGPELPDLQFLPPPTTECPSDRRKEPIERFSIAAQLQLMKALAILGWAAFILELLRV